MSKSIMKKAVAIALTTVVGISMVGCGGEQKTASNDTKSETPKVEEKKQEQQPEKKEEIVEMKFLSNLPDRSSGQGKLEQMLIDQYANENGNVKIKVEALQDEPYKQKFKAYLASNDLPDLYMVWGQPAFFDPVMKNGYAAELSKSDYDDYGFFPGSLDGFSYDGKLYGLPRNTDVMVLYYNKALFEKYNVKVPQNFEELIAAAKTFRENGIAPCAINGKDKWTLGLMYQDLAQKVSGDQKLIYDGIHGKTTFGEQESFLQAAQYMKQLADVKFFQDSFIAADYGAANNLFAQEKAAMYYMGSWEMGMVSNDAFPESFRENMRATVFPIIDGGKGKATDLIAWNGGGYAIAAESEVKDQAVDVLNYIFKPDNWAKNAWQMGICISAQKYDQFLTGNETTIQKELTKILGDSTSLSGTSWFDSVTPSFKTDGENLSQELTAGIKSPEEFIQDCDKAVKKALKK